MSEESGFQLECFYCDRNNRRIERESEAVEAGWGDVCDVRHDDECDGDFLAICPDCKKEST